MHITLRQVQIFEAVARHLSFTRAAEELYLTQPAVSMQIRQLEANIGLALFEQLGKKVYLTEAGQEFHHYSKAITGLLEEGKQVMEGLRGLNRGRLSIAVASTANYFVSRLLAVFSQRYRDALISLDVTNRENLLRQLEGNRIDMVIMGRPPEEPEVVSQPFMDNPLVVIASPGHPLASESDIPLSRLQSETFLVREQGSGTRIAMERFFAEQKVRLNTGMEMSSNEAIKQVVQAGLGLGIVSEYTLELELETQRLVMLQVQGFPILRHWYVVHRQGKRLSPMAHAFKEFVLHEAVNVLEELHAA